MADPGAAPDVAPDVAEYAFSDTGPWVVVVDDLVWMRGIDRVRARTRAQVPVLLARRRVPPLGRLARVMVSVGTALLIWQVRERGTPRSRVGLARRLRV